MSENTATDPAAIFGCAISLRDAALKLAPSSGLSLSDVYGGMDGFMREIMRVATHFETWATAHVAFDHLGQIWPYFMEDHFGTACMAVMEASALEGFDEADCLRVSQQLDLPLFYEDGLNLPLHVTAPNPVSGSPFTHLGIQTLRLNREDGEAVPFVSGDDGEDPDFDYPTFALHGISAEGLWEPISRLATYREAVSLASKLAPGINFPERPIIRA